MFVYRDALVRWITGTSFPVTIADFSLVPREVREDVEVLAAVRPHRGREEAGDVGLPCTMNGLVGAAVPLTWRANARRGLLRA